MITPTTPLQRPSGPMMHMLRMLDGCGEVVVGVDGIVRGGQPSENLPGTPLDWLRLVQMGYVEGCTRVSRLRLSDAGDMLIGSERARQQPEQHPA